MKNQGFQLADLINAQTQEQPAQKSSEPRFSVKPIKKGPIHLPTGTSRTK